MTKIKCITLGLVDCNTERTPKGNAYLFMRGTFTEIPDKDDIEFFLDKRHNGAFVAKDLVKEIKVKVKDKIDKVKEKVTGEKKKPEIYTREGLFALSKDIQVKIIQDYDSESKIPRYEKGRVDLILKFQANNGGDEV